MKTKTHYSIKVTKKNGEVSTIRTWKKRRFYNFIQRVKNSEVEKYSACITYGKDISLFGKKALFKNEGEYEAKKDLLLVLKCFFEEGLWDDTT